MDETKVFHLIDEIRGNCLQKAQFDAPLSLSLFSLFFVVLFLISFLLNVSLNPLYISLYTKAKGGGGLEAVTFGEEQLD